jgi:hypothetical protein
LRADGPLAGGADRRHFLQAQALQQEERDLSLRLGQAPARELRFA